MPYVGNPLATAFSGRLKQDLTGGSGTSFTLSHAVSSPNDLSIYINHIRQEPTTAYTVNGTALTMTGSVAGTDDFYIIYDELATQSISHPANQALTATAGTFTSGLVGTTGTFSGAVSGTTGTFSGDFTVDTDTLFVDVSQDNVGINTNAVDSDVALEVNGNVAFKNGSNYSLYADVDGALTAYYNGSSKLTTTANGIGVEAGSAYSHDTNMKGIDTGDQAFYGEYDGGSLYIVKNRYYNGSNWVAKENGAGSAINMDTSGHTHIQHSANVNAGQNATLTSIASFREDYVYLKQTRNSVAQFFQNLHSSAPYGVYIEFPNVAKNNTDNYFLSCVEQGNGRMKIFSNGTLKNSTGTYTSFSDERLKSDIVDAKSQWEDIKALNFKNFIKFDNPDFKQLGLIAQDVEKVSPNLVFETPPEPEEIKHSSVFGTLYEDGDELPEDKKVGDVKEVKSKVKNVKDSILYMKSVKALQEAMERIEILEAKVKVLENK